ncbi:MAG: helix-turn-helix domain-containing protein [Dysosmobacter sp.]
MRPAGGEEYLSGTNSVENTIWRLKRKLEPDPKHPDYIKTVLRAGYKMNNPMNKVVNLRSD